MGRSLVPVPARYGECRFLSRHRQRPDGAPRGFPGRRHATCSACHARRKLAPAERRRMPGRSFAFRRGCSGPASRPAAEEPPSTEGRRGYAPGCRRRGVHLALGGKLRKRRCVAHRMRIARGRQPPPALPRGVRETVPCPSRHKPPSRGPGRTSRTKGLGAATPVTRVRLSRTTVSSSSPPPASGIRASLRAPRIARHWPCRRQRASAPSPSAPAACAGSARRARPRGSR